MSDTHAWPPSASTEAAFAEFAAHRDRVRALAGTCDGEARELLLAEWSALEQLERKMRHLLGVRPDRVSASAAAPAVMGERRRNVGENTRAWLAGQSPAMPRNRGHL